MKVGRVVEGSMKVGRVVAGSVEEMTPITSGHVTTSWTVAIYIYTYALEKVRENWVEKGKRQSIREIFLYIYKTDHTT